MKLKRNLLLQKEVTAEEDYTFSNALPTIALAIDLRPTSNVEPIKQRALTLKFASNVIDKKLFIYPQTNFDGNHKAQSIWLFLIALESLCSEHTAGNMAICEVNHFYFFLEDSIRNKKTSYEKHMTRVPMQLDKPLSLDGAVSLYLEQAGFPITSSLSGVSFTVVDAKSLFEIIRNRNTIDPRKLNAAG